MRAIAAIGVLVLFLLLLVAELTLQVVPRLHFLWVSRQADPDAVDRISAFEARLAPIRQSLPPGAVAGYRDGATDAGPQEGKSSMEFYLTQYSLIPVIVRNEGERAPLIVVYPDHVELQRMEKE